jgi:serine/threonine protein kinase/WD40 repeat protein
MTGQRLGSFQVGRRLASGGSADVYLAEQHLLGRPAAIKVLRSDWFSKRAVDRFLQEARIASRLDHPYAAHIYEFGAEPDRALWIAMEYVPGQSLAQQVRRDGPLAVAELVPLFERICEVVHSAHEAGIVHRDLKPSNIMVVSRAGQLLPKLLDFGIARPERGEPPPALPVIAPGTPRAAGAAAGAAVDDAVTRDLGRPRDPDATAIPTGDGDRVTASLAPGADRLTAAGAMMGSPPYMSPEQWEDVGAVDRRTDIYALGVTAYELLTGELPFTGTLGDLERAHRSRPPPALGRGLPAALDAVIARAVAKDPAARFATALELAAAVRRASGLSAAPPALDPALRTWIERGPQPIADAVAVLAMARDTASADAAAVRVAAAAARWIGILALAARNRVGGEAPGLGALHAGTIASATWIELARAPVAPFAARTEAYPIPELVGALAAGPRLAAVAGAGDLAGALAPFAALCEYRVGVSDGHAVASWMGAHRAHREPIAHVGPTPPANEVTVYDRAGAPLLLLSPLVQARVPAPGQPQHLLCFAGAIRGAAALRSEPHGFEWREDELWTWIGARAAAEAPAAPAEGEAPYLGLVAFDAGRADVFFGREREAMECRNLLRVAPLVVIAGPSGAGKSSFVHAGLVAELDATWRAIAFRPGAAPMAALAAALARAGVPGAEGDAGVDHLGRWATAAGATVVLVVDQAEEMLTVCRDAAERDRFAGFLAAAAATDGAIRVVLSIRDDFLARANELGPLRGRLAEGVFLLASPERAALERILVEPARRAGYRFEDDALARELVAEVDGQLGALPLVSFTARELWDRRDREHRVLTRAAYRELGGVAGTLARHAEGVLAALDPRDLPAVRGVFRLLSGDEDTRACLARAQLARELGDDPRLDAVIERMVAARLLVPRETLDGEPAVEIIHESLFRAWPRLITWREEDLELVRLAARLRADAKHWDDRGRPRGLVWSRDAVIEHDRFRDRITGLGPVETAFVAASRAAATRAQRIRRAVVAGVVVALAATAAILAWSAGVAAQSRAVAEDRLVRLYAEQGLRELSDGNDARALVYLSAAYSTGVTDPWVRYSIARALRGFDREEAPFSAHTRGVEGVAWSGDGATLYTIGDGEVRAWRRDGARYRLAASQPSHAELAYGGVRIVGDRVLTLGRDSVRVYRAADLTPEHAIPIPTPILVTASGDGATLAVTTMAGEVHVVAADGTVVRVLPAGTQVGPIALDPTGSRLATVGPTATSRLWPLPGGDPIVLDVDMDVGEVFRFLPDERVLAASHDGVVHLLDARTGRRLGAFGNHAAIAGLFVAPGGGIFVVDSEGATSLWRIDLAAAPVRIARHGSVLGRVERAMQSPDGRIVVVTHAGGKAAAYDADLGARLTTFEMRPTSPVAIDGERRRAAIGAADGTVRVVALERDQRMLVVPEGGPVTGRAVFVGPTRHVLALDQLPGRTSSAGLYDADSLARIARFVGPLAQTVAAIATPDGTRIVTASRTDDPAGSATLAVWTGGERGSTWPAPPGRLAALAAASDGTRVALYTDRGDVRIHDLASGAELAAANLPAHEVSALVASPADGAFVATTASVLHVVGAGGDVRPTTLDAVQAVAFSADGHRVYTGGLDGRVVARSWPALAPLHVYEPHGGAVTAIAVSPDERFLAVGTSLGEVYLWDATSRRVLVRAGAHDYAVLSLSFDAAGDALVSSSGTSTLIWDTSVETRAPAAIARLVRCRAGLVLDGTTLVPRPPLPDCAP